MINALMEIGEYTIEKQGKDTKNPLNILIDNPKNNKTQNVIFICLRNENDRFEYNGIEIEEYSNKKLLKYIYKKGSPRGIDFTPTAMITEVEKTFKGKIIAWFRKYNKIDEREDNNFLVNINSCLKKYKEQIVKDLKAKYSIENNIISLKIDNKYIGDYSVFKEILIKAAKENFYFRKSFRGENSISKSENQLCSVCNKIKEEVYGFVSTYNFYTVDKPGFVSGGFKQKFAWKNYPVCLNCALILEEAKKYVGNNFNFKFYGLKYILLPKFILPVEEKYKNEILDIISTQTNPEFKSKIIHKLTDDENEILQTLSEQNNYLNLNFIFYEAPKGYDGSVFNILCSIVDILPSRLKKLFDTKKEIDDINIFKEHKVPVFKDKKKIGEKELTFDFSILRSFFYDFTNKRWISVKYFLDIVDRIFTEKNIDYNFLLKFIIKKIREEFSKDNATATYTLKGFMLLNYLDRLGILKQNKEGDGKMTENISKIKEVNEELNKKINSFFDQFKQFFDSDAKKAIFLEGVLVQFLLNIQYQERGASPFRVKLKGLKLDEKQIKKLLAEIQNKLEEYGKNYYRDLETIISEYFISSGNNWKISNADISFYFVLGMNLSKKFKKKLPEETDEI